MATMTERTNGSREPAKEALWRRPWMVPLAFVALAFLAYSLPPYLGLDADQSRVPPPPGLDWYYPLLISHIGFGSVAMVTCVLQIWPWFRQRYPAAHRRVGRIYVFAGVLPAGISAFGIGLAAPFGPVAAVSNVVLALLWLSCTIAGFRMARERRFADHRRWMIRSFTLTMSTITNRLWGVVFGISLSPQLETTFAGNPQFFTMTIAGITTWAGWVIPLLIAEWWLTERKKRPGRAGRDARRARQTADWSAPDGGTPGADHLAASRDGAAH